MGANYEVILVPVSNTITNDMVIHKFTTSCDCRIDETLELNDAEIVGDNVILASPAVSDWMQIVASGTALGYKLDNWFDFNPRGGPG